jgi:hypothetical protein
MEDLSGDLLLAVLRGDPPSDLTEEDMEPLFDLAGDHGLIGMVHEALTTHGKCFTEWKDFAVDLEIKTGVQLKAAAEIATALRERGVDALFVKGVALVLTVYGRGGVRDFSDMDVLISPERLRDAHEALVALGFALEEKEPNPIEVSYVREKLPGHPVCVDLHCAFTAADGFQAPVNIPLPELFARARTVEGVPVPSYEDSLLLAAANLARKSAEPFMLVVDFARLTDRRPEWGSVTSRARAWGLRTPLWLGLSLAQRCLGAPVPESVLAELKPPPWRARRLERLLDGDRLWLSDKQQQWRYRVLFKLLCLDDNKQILRALLALPKGALRKRGVGRYPARELQTAAKQ